jgi:hypothetical protein
MEERRQKKDFWAKSLILLNIIAWVLLLIILLIFHRAQPEFETFFDRFYKLKLRTFWDIHYLTLLIYFVMPGIVISSFGLVISIYRGRRKSDHSVSLLIMGIISFIFLIIALIRL